MNGWKTVIGNHEIDMTQRENERFPLQIQVDYALDEDADVLYSADISERGIFLETVCPYPVGTKLALRFNLPGSTRLICVVAEVARVVRETDHSDRWTVPGMGMAFMAIEPEDMQYIRSFILRATGS